MRSVSRGRCRTRRPSAPAMSLWRRQLFLLFLLFLLLLLGWTWWCTDWFQVCGWCLSSYISAIGSGTFIQTKLNGIPWIVVTFLSIGGFVTRCYYSHLNFNGVCQIYTAQECIPVGCVPSDSVATTRCQCRGLSSGIGCTFPGGVPSGGGYQAYPQKGPGTRHTHPLEGTWDQAYPPTRRDLGPGIPDPPPGNVLGPGIPTHHGKDMGPGIHTSLWLEKHL